MSKVILLLLAAVALFIFSTGAFEAEGTAKGPAFGGCIAVSVGKRTVTLSARRFRPNRSYYTLRIR
jgi:hypothetical protein